MDAVSHPAIDWSDTRRRRKPEVAVTCPTCGAKRFWEIWTLQNRLRQGTFTGYCRAHRVGRPQTAKRPSHPAVDWADTPTLPIGQRRLTRVAVVCPACKQRRYAATGSVAAHIRAGRFTGLCLLCSPNAPKREWIRLGPGRKLDPVKGYVRLSLEAVAPEDHWLFLAMRRTVPTVTEHRMVMAKTLGRPLTSNELVDHQDGVKTNNDPGNLRLYRRGRNDPGDTSGYGTFYHEWQLALAEVRRLREQLTRYS